MTCPRHPDGTPWRSTSLRGTTGHDRLDAALGVAAALCVTACCLAVGALTVAAGVLLALAVPQR